MQELLQEIHQNLILKLIPFADRIPIHLVYIGGLVVGAALILGWMTVIAMGWIWAERRVAGYIQARVGPNRVGPFGLLQSLADGIKLLTKEDIIPTKADRILYELAPLLVFAGAFVPFVALPFSQHLVIADMDLGLFYIMAFGAMEVVGILMAGWGPNSKWSLYGGMRLAAQMLSYEIPLGLSVLTVVVLAGSLNLTDIVLWQTKGFLIWDDVNLPMHGLLGFTSWAIFRSPWSALPAFLIFFTAGLAETKRAPFDLPEAESELVAGFHTEYTGIRFSFFFLAEYCAMYVVCVLAAVVFLGGWYWPLPTVFEVEPANIIQNISNQIVSHAHYESIADAQSLTALGLTSLKNVWVFVTLALWHGPWATISALTEPASVKLIVNELCGFANLVGKSFVLLFVMLWIRWTLPRIRIDQVMHMCLKVMLPIGLACVLLAAVQAVVTYPSPTPYRPVAEAKAEVPATAQVPKVETKVNEKAAVAGADTSKGGEINSKGGAK